MYFSLLANNFGIRLMLLERRIDFQIDLLLI
jgi:hypothetical protein